MFERYTQSARRIIFFARYEASQYGSDYIESGHLLLGLLREDMSLLRKFLGEGNVEPEIRAEIERHTERRQKIPTSAEIPLTDECKRILRLAAQESDRLGHRHVGTEHLLLALLGIEKSLACAVLQARGLKTAAVRQQLANDAQASGSMTSVDVKRPRDDAARVRLDSFLTGLKWNNASDLIDFFADNARAVDVFGRRYTREEVFKNVETLFAPYAKKNAASVVEEIVADSGGLFVASVLWKNAIVASLERVWIHRMSVVMVLEDGDWQILLMHVTPLQTAAGASAP